MELKKTLYFQTFSENVWRNYFFNDFYQQVLPFRYFEDCSKVQKFLIGNLMLYNLVDQTKTVQLDPKKSLAIWKSNVCIYETIFVCTDLRLWYQWVIYYQIHSKLAQMFLITKK